MKKRTLILGLSVLMGITALTSCEKDSEEMKTAADMTISEYAASNPDFSILVQALSKANLVNALNGEGNYTVFAPTNNAFNDLFGQLGISGVNDLSAEALTPILLYHVLGQKVLSSALQEGYYNTISPAQNNFSSINISTGNGVKLNKLTNVTLADVTVKNGVIHVIDKVLLPPTVVDHALANDSFSILVQAVVKAGLVETLTGSGPFTIFAPTNEAFETLFGQLGITGLADLTAEQLIPILQYHVVSGNIRSTDLVNGTVQTLNGPIEINLVPAPSINTTSLIIATNVQAVNGVIHVIDEVLLPQE